MRVFRFLWPLVAAMSAFDMQAVDMSHGLSSNVIYGICSHLAGGEYKKLDETCDMIALTGIRYVRADFNWNHCQKKPGGEWDFSQFDRVVTAAEKRGLTVLPILFGIPSWAHPVWEHLEEWGDYVGRIVERYGDRMPVVEIWNEENLAGFWKSPPNPQQYAETLRVAYAAAKRANPSVRVALGGTSGVPLDYIRGVYEHGGAKFFDIMNVHPYSRPARPEGFVDRELDALRKLMKEFGDEGKAIWITEIGWPTQTRNVGDFGLVKAALRVSRPEKRRWKVILADCGTNRNEQAERDYLSVLPLGSEVVSCSPTETNRRLAEGWADAVFYPKYESYPVETVSAVRKFVKEGGTLLDFGGMPMWAPFKEKEGKLQSWKTWEDRAALRIGVDAWFMNDKSAPEILRCFVTEDGQKAGVNFLPDGLKFTRFQTAQYLKPGDRMVPLMAGKNPKNGKDVVGACVYLFDSDFKGRIAVSGLRVGINAENTEFEQAQYLVRALALAFAEGVEAFFPYEFRAEERDQFDREHHFGITHSNFAPKPAWGAYKNFISCRPVGSKQVEGPWRDEKGCCFPQWTCPDGKAAGMLWTTGPDEEHAISFDSDRVGFRNMAGRVIVPRKLGPRTWLVPFTGSPIYFIGGRIAK